MGLAKPGRKASGRCFGSRHGVTSDHIVAEIEPGGGRVPGEPEVGRGDDAALRYEPDGVAPRRAKRAPSPRRRRRCARASPRGRSRRAASCNAARAGGSPWREGARARRLRRDGRGDRRRGAFRSLRKRARHHASLFSCKRALIEIAARDAGRRGDGLRRFLHAHRLSASRSAESMSAASGVSSASGGETRSTISPFTASSA